MTADLMRRMDFFGKMLNANLCSRSTLAVAFMLLYRHLNSRTGRCDPSLPTLANETGLTPRAVQKAIAELRNSGWWRIAKGVGRGNTNSYAPCLEKANTGSPITTRKGEQPFTLTAPENTNNRVRKHERLFVRTSKNQESDSYARTYDAHRPAARSLGCNRQVDAPDGANADFEDFWDIYPHRGEFSDPKKPARAKFEAAVKRGIDPATIIAGAERYREHVEQEGTKPRFRPQAKTWLDEERWGQPYKPEVPQLQVGMN
jgi:hypothetical protein